MGISLEYPVKLNSYLTDVTEHYLTSNAIPFTAYQSNTKLVRVFSEQSPEPFNGQVFKQVDLS